MSFETRYAWKKHFQSIARSNRPDAIAMRIADQKARVAARADFRSKYAGNLTPENFDEANEYILERIAFHIKAASDE